jgi:hypothetical protein
MSSGRFMALILGGFDYDNDASGCTSSALLRRPDFSVAGIGKEVYLLLMVRVGRGRS